MLTPYAPPYAGSVGSYATAPAAAGGYMPAATGGYVMAPAAEAAFSPGWGAAWPPAWGPTAPGAPPGALGSYMPTRPGMLVLPGSVGFVPDEVGARLNPRRYKCAPLAAVRAIPPAARIALGSPRQFRLGLAN
eukprot:1490334-Prymnesium_polylepis.1